LSIGPVWSPTPRRREEVTVADRNLTSTARTEAFSDGVFAIAITLLVLDLKVPATADASDASGLIARLLAEWPAYLGYLLSFAMIGIMWVNHHNIFRYIRRTDNTFVILNILFLLCVSFVPFPTGVLARYLMVPQDRAVATAFYAATLTMTGVTYNLIWRYAIHRHQLLDPDVSPEVIRRISRQFLAGPVMYAVATATAFVSVTVSLGIIALLALLYLVLPDKVTR
jgi:uncharacterized membrane protein